MPSHEFGIMPKKPEHGQRYDEYKPEKYHCIGVHDIFLQPLLHRIAALDFFWHSLDVPGKGLAYYGITLIPPQSHAELISIIGCTDGLAQLRALLATALAENKYVIHFGI